MGDDVAESMEHHAGEQMNLNPDQVDSLVGWVSTNGITLVIVAVVLLVVYRWARPLIHRVLVDAMRTQLATVGDDTTRHDEIEKRVNTLEDLLAKILRSAVFVAIALVILSLFDLWPLLASVGLIVAALTLAGKDIVLDYLMGMLILIEGQFYKGDIVQIKDIEGSVQEVALRRTLILDATGTVHSISNGQIRASSNRTRHAATATIHIEGVPDRDLERAIRAIDDVGRAAAADPSLTGVLIDTPAYSGTTLVSAGGATIRMTGRVQAEHRATVEDELRRRVATALAEAGIVPGAS
jgi:small conductance mechanosensitive channel